MDAIKWQSKRWKKVEKVDRVEVEGGKVYFSPVSTPIFQKFHNVNYAPETTESSVFLKRS